MHWLDTTLLIALAAGAVLGFVSGLFLQIARIASLGLAVVATILLHASAGQLLRAWVLREADPGVVQASAYVLVFLTVYISLFLLTRLLRMWLRATDLAMADRILGALLGSGKFALLLGAACLLLQNTAHPVAQEWLDHSTLAPVFARGMEKAVAVVPENYKQPVFDSVRQMQEALTHGQAKDKEK